jgi:hypothetical protein
MDSILVESPSFPMINKGVAHFKRGRKSVKNVACFADRYLERVRKATLSPQYGTEGLEIEESLYLRL